MAQAGRGIFSVDRPNLLSLMARDHGPRDGTPLEPWVRARLAEAGVRHADGEIVLQAFPRVLGYVFNPISIFHCHDREGGLRAVLCEVSNTFGERHDYLLAHPDGRAIGPRDWIRAAKVFHVSPFCEVKGHYRFRFAGDERHQFARIDYHDGDGKLLVTAIDGEARPVDAASLARAFFGYPLMTAGVIARIHWQALRLWLEARALVFEARAAAPGDDPVNTPEHIARLPAPTYSARLLFQVLSRLVKGRLTVTTPEGTRRVFAGPEARARWPTSRSATGRRWAAWSAPRTSAWPSAGATGSSPPAT